MGLEVGKFSIALDRKDSSSNVNFVSHAHSDHLSGVRKNSDIIASKATADLIEAKKGITTNLIEADGIKLLNAGHILGSKQLYVESDGCTFLYSGDYQLQHTDVAEPIEFMKTDILIIDSTYYRTDLAFDPRDEVTENIQMYTKKKLDSGIVLFGAYTLGKAQELIKILNDVGIFPVVEPSIDHISRVYKKHGITLDYACVSSDEDRFNEATSGNFVGIVGMSKLGQTKQLVHEVYGKKVFSAVATGFAKMFRFNTDVQFGLSDHADFKQATEYIDACNPSHIYTYGHNADAFARALSLKCYVASPYSEPIVAKVSQS